MTLVVETLVARYGSTRVLREVSLQARPGEIVALIGANGVGKSTLLNTIAGLHRSATGKISVDGTAILGRPAHRIAGMGIALVPEGRRLFSELTVRENLQMGLHGLRVPGREAHARIDSVFAMFPILAEFRSRPAGLLSGGQQQMLAIGRALVRNPTVLLLDEPSLGLAPTLVQQILATVKELAQQDVAVLLAEQNAAAALAVATYGIVLENGCVARADDARTLLEDEDVSQHYLGGAARESGARSGQTISVPDELRSRELMSR
ncbi:MAG TPA: ABC transporter ATP-binding protein [Nocardioidaceae bacterium]|nr:ABC transporter ATP-binding protein [Nocardioidaceae bacterium]